MARKRWKKTGAIRFVAFQHWMLKTPAYRHACPGERAALVELYALHNASNNGHLYLSVRELAARLGVTEKPAQKYLRGLVAKGFIKPKVRGSFSCKNRQATTWTLTEFGTDQDIKATVDFMRWRPGDDFTPDAEKKPRWENLPLPVGKITIVMLTYLLKKAPTVGESPTVKPISALSRWEILPHR